MTGESDPKFVVTTPGSIFVAADGETVRSEYILDTNATDSEIINMVSRTHGTDPSQAEVVYPGETPKTRGGRLAVAFGRWNSSWDPDAQRQRANADLN